MAEVLVVVVSSLIAIVVWAVVGHGIWILLRIVFGGFSYPRRKCPECGRSFLGDTCSNCIQLRRETRQSTPSVDSDLRAAERLIKYALFKGWVDEAQHASNRELLNGLQSHVRGTAPQDFKAEPGELGPTTPNTAVPPEDVPPGAVPPGAVPLGDRDMPSSVPAEAAGLGREPAVWDDAVVEAELVDAELVETTTVPTKHVQSKDGSFNAAFADEATSPTASKRPPLGSLVASGLLQRFMEKSNIRWVELISAVLIVVCSIGLVISLWSTLSSTSRFFPSLVFLAATAAVHGAGQYTLRRWKLRSTSRGILHIGLMLIPLAVLVGILLARRDDALPRLDAMTLATLAIGTLVYGALAWTASRALFTRRWPVVTAATVACSLTLVAVHFAAEHQQLETWLAWLLPWPIALVTQLAAISTGRVSARRAAHRNRLTRRLVGVVVQTCFAAGVVVVFWGLAAHRAGGLSSAWWMMVAVLSAAWIGWSQSLWPIVSDRPTDATRPRVASAFHSSLLIAGWSWGGVCAMLLVLAMWQNSEARWQLATLLSLVAASWILLGWLRQLKSSFTAGLLALLIASTLLIEGASLKSQILTTSDTRMAVEQLSWVDWISCSRSTILSSIGLSCAGLGIWWSRRSTADHETAKHREANYFLSRSPQTLYRSIAIQGLANSATQAGSMSMVLAAVMALLASLTPWGVIPYGGNWAPSMLAVYGVLSCVAAVYLKPRWGEQQHKADATDTRTATTLIDGLMPIGMGLLLMSALRLCQTSPMLADVLGELRPSRAWGVGLTGLATLWSLAAAALRAGCMGDPTQQRNHTHWLAGGALLASVVSLPAVWQLSEHYAVACWVGWTLPITCLALWFAWRHNAWRELSLLVLCCWVSSVELNVGEAFGWWSALGRTGAPAPFVLAIALTVFAFEAVVLWNRERTGHPLPQGEPAFEGSLDESTLGTTAAWWSSPPHWGSPVAIAFSWLLLLQALLPQAIVTIADSLGIAPRTWIIPPPVTSQLIGSTIGSAIGQAGDNASVRALVLVAMFASPLSLSLLGVWLGRARRQWWLVNSFALLPIYSALLVSLVVAPGVALTAALWVLAGWILVSELLPLYGHRTAHLSHVAWQRVISADKAVPPATMWLVLARALAVGLLLLGSGAYLLAALWGTLPPAVGLDISATWAENLWRVSTVLAPLLLVVSLRWCASLVSGQSPNMISLAGGLSALTAAAMLAVSRSLLWPDTAFLFVQATALVAAALAWLTILWATLRNFVGLRKLTQGRTAARELLPKSMKGRSWKQAEQASWSLVCLAFLNVLTLGVAAVGLVVAYPAVVLPGLDSVGGWFGGAALAITLALFSWLATKRGAPRFGLLAVALGLAAPLVATSYANYLVAYPQHKIIGAEDFEPYRMLLVLWLVALGIGFGVRLVTMRESKLASGDDRSWLSHLGEGAWLLLALCVGSLALVSIPYDPNRLWPLAELSALALVGVLSGVASGQVWRGYLAAFAAAAGLFGWLVYDTTHEYPSEAVWCVLWGPVWVAAVAWTFTHWLGLSQQSQRTVDQIVSLYVPMASAAVSFAWILQFAPQAISALTWSVVAMSLTSLALACAQLWDIRTSKRGLAVYLNLIALALVGSVAVSAWYELPELQAWLLWMAAGLGAMAVMAGLLREWVRRTPRAAPTLGLGQVSIMPQLQHALTGMAGLHASAGLLALVPSVVLVLSFEQRALRMAATVLPLIGACAILPIASGRRKLAYRYCGLLLTTATLVLLSWADLPQAWSVASSVEAWWYIQRVFAALVVLGGIVYPWLAHSLRRSDQWDEPLLISGWAALGLGTVCGLVLLSFQFDDRWRIEAATVALGTKLLSLAAWTIVIGRLLQFAARPHSLDRRLPVAVRQAAIYAAQIGCVILCAVTYAHFPKLFSGVLAAWWPIVVFGIAMLSAGLGEWLSRAGQSVIADPVQRSSLILPIIPLAGVWWIKPENSIWLWHEWQSYWLLLLIAAGLFGLHGWLRRSMEIRLVSAMLLLASFWVLLLSQPNLRFMEHPQLWLLPPALATLAFVEWNRRRLEPNVVTAARYGAVLVAYLSSTSEIFLNAFAGQFWQPLLLLVLALGGVAVGIALQVRAFLYCGVAFTSVALLAMVWHAQQAIGQVWPWWAFGIATGIGLIFMLGYFEKNRARVVAYLERLKQWE